MARPRTLFTALLALAGCGGFEPPVPDAGLSLPADVRATVERELASVRAAPSEARRWFELGATYEANALVHLAEPCYARAAELDPGDARASYHHARLLAERGAYEAALDVSAGALESAPSYAPLHWRRGQWFFALGLLDEAEESFQRAADVGARDPAGRWGLAQVALERGEPERALAALATLDGSGGDFAYTHHLRASALRALGESERAAVEALRAGEPVWIDPWKAEVEERRGGFHGELERVREAVQSGALDDAARRLEALLAAEPLNVNVLGMLSDVYLASGRAGEAEELLLAARGRLPGHDRIAFNLSLVYEKLGDEARALVEIDECLRLRPALGVAHLRRGRILSTRGELAPALAALEEARRLGESSAELWRQLGSVHARLGGWSAAAEAFERAAALQPDASVALRVAEAHARAGDGPSAWRALATARALDASAERLGDVEELVRALVGAAPEVRR